MCVCVGGGGGGGGGATREIDLNNSLHCYLFISNNFHTLEHMRACLRAHAQTHAYEHTKVGRGHIHACAHV